MAGLTPEPNYYGRQLQREVKRLREQARLTQEEAGELVHMEFKKLSRIERRQLPTYHELVMLLDAYGVLACDYGPYIELWELAKQRPWWRDFHLEDTRYVRMEDEADTKYEFQLGHIPTLLQTEEYAELSINASKRSVRKFTDLRMRQQERLTSDPRLQLQALIHAPVLHQGVNREQMNLLIERAELPNVTIQIVPQRNTLHDGLHGSVILLSFDDLNEPDAAFSETLVGLQETQDPERTATIRHALDRISEQAMSPEETLACLKSARPAL
ncbi:helix-turn-helix domain-containing protein [Kibdelosporangium philippinense]|uniref:Helix-turn-helix domain-containing protein n=1 Tax=Kibdelosporangium philippinense TaxID=211113 RepID=A0ABS8ZCF0_9PSEU|nr:helix-turn-helix transcriptional regulator [Kibdelosporangium philippinense]MCE7004203.1 helix-turn-helix domain-containing protein [Kibdelosporangium philippinense]